MPKTPQRSPLIWTVFLPILVFGISGGQNVHAQQEFGQDYLGKTGAWHAALHRRGEKKETICSLVSYPVRSHGAPRSRKQPYLQVAKWPGQQTVVSLVGGIDYQSDSQIFFQIDGQHEFRLFPHGEAAWVLNREDARVIKAFRAGNRLEVRICCSGDREFTDIYSLSGFTAALGKLSANC